MGNPYAVHVSPFGLHFFIQKNSMNHLTLLKYPLLPLLIPQGLWAKWRTPRLDEASGERIGSIGKGKLVRLLILGDSAAAGVGVKHQDQALIGQLCHLFDVKNFQLDWQLHAKSGNTLIDLKQLAEQLPQQSFDFVIISSGVNDILKQHSVQKWQIHYQELYQYLQNHFGQPQILFTQVPPLQHFSALPKTLAWYLGQHAQAFNKNLNKNAQHLSNLHYVPLTLPTTREYLAEDGFHPSHLSYTIWAKNILDYMKQEQLL